LFSAVEAERVAMTQAWNASTCALVTPVGSAASSSASGSGGVLGEVPAELGGGEEVVVAGGLRVVVGDVG
jgi:hypothetical protein